MITAPIAVAVVTICQTLALPSCVPSSLPLIHQKLLKRNPDMELDIEGVGVRAAPTAVAARPTDTAGEFTATRRMLILK